MLRTVNRVLLALTGVVLLGVGLMVLAGGLDLYRRWDLHPPGDVPLTSPGGVLLTDGARTRWRDEGWWWPAVIAVLVLLVLIALWWLLAQLRRPRLGEVLVDSGDGEGALLRGRALEDVLAAEAQGLSGVERAHVRLLGRRTRPRTRVGLLLAPHARPDAALWGLRTQALEHARNSAGLAELSAEVRMRCARHPAERVQ